MTLLIAKIAFAVWLMIVPWIVAAGDYHGRGDFIKTVIALSVVMAILICLTLC